MPSNEQANDHPSTVLRDFVARHFAPRLHPPAGSLAHPYLDPAGEHYVDSLWDWDAYFCALGLRPWAADVADHVQGSVLNFIAFQGDDGRIPYVLSPESIRPGPREPDQPWNPAKPVLAQLAELGLEYGEVAGRSAYTASDVVAPFARHVRHWEETQLSHEELFVFRSHRGSGTDNHPAVYGRPFNSSADVLLNVLMVREYAALARLARKAGDEGGAAAFVRKGDALAERVRERMWDPIDGLFYNLDVGRRDAGDVNQSCTWAVPLKFRMWTGLAPLWGRIATAEQAERLVREHVMNEAEYLSPNGLRSMARTEPAYTLFAGQNPSNWQGPVWTVSNYIVYQGLIDAGYLEEARTIASRLVKMLARDVRAHGLLHEYYHPETGEGLTHPGFFNWNTLAVGMGEGDSVEDHRECGY